MSRRLRLVFVLAASLSLAACAGSITPPPPESQVHPAWLTGNWYAIGWQVGAGTKQAEADITVTFAPDGTWKTPAGGSGTSWLVGDDVFIKGSTADGFDFQHRLRIRQNTDGSRELYGAVAARPGATQVHLKKIP